MLSTSSWRPLTLRVVYATDWVLLPSLPTDAKHEPLLDGPLLIPACGISVSISLMADGIDFIIEEETFDTIVCSIDGIDRHTFESLRPPADFDTVRQNFLYLIEQPNRPKVIINNGLEFSMVGKQTSSEFQCMLDKADEVINYVFHDWGGRVQPSPEIVPEDKGKGFCRYAFNSVVLHANGMIGKCCRDLNGDTAYGDFSKHSLKDIYHSRRRKKDLLWMALRKRHRATGCGGCGVT